MADAESNANAGLDWANFHFLNSYQSSSPTQQRKIQLKDFSMVVIRDSLLNDDFSIFPPSNHENLQPPSSEKHEEQGSTVSVQSNSPSTSSSSSSSFSSFSFSDDEISYSPSPIPYNHHIRKFRVASSWMILGTQILYSRFIAIASTFWSKSARNWLLSPSARIWLVVTIWWLYKRARQWRLRQSTNQMKRIIEEKDEKIGRLLNQIAQLNGVLLAQQKGLPGI